MHQTDDTGSIAGGETVFEFVQKYKTSWDKRDHQIRQDFPTLLNNTIIAAYRGGIIGH